MNSEIFSHLGIFLSSLYLYIYIIPYFLYNFNSAHPLVLWVEMVQCRLEKSYYNEHYKYPLKYEIIDIDKCVEVTNIINPILDREDPIKESYTLDVSTKEKGR